MEGLTGFGFLYAVLSKSGQKRGCIRLRFLTDANSLTANACSQWTSISLLHGTADAFNPVLPKAAQASCGASDCSDFFIYYIEVFMPFVTHAPHAKGDLFVDYEEKVLEDVKAEPGAQSNGHEAPQYKA